MNESRLDTAKAQEALTDEGVPIRHARAIISEMRKLESGLATKADVLALGDRLDTRIDALNLKIDTKIDALDLKIDTKIDALDLKFDTKIDALTNEMRGRFEETDRKIESSKTELQAELHLALEQTKTSIERSRVWYLMMQLATITVIIAALKFF